MRRNLVQIRSMVLDGSAVELLALAVPLVAAALVIVRYLTAA